MRNCISRMVLFAGTAFSVSAVAQVGILSPGVALRVQLDHRYSIKTGTRIEGHLTTPVYLVDHQVIPVNTRISGVVLGSHPVDDGTRTRAILAGDFTPLAIPDITFDKLTLPDGTELHLETKAVQRDGAIVRMRTSNKKPSLTTQVSSEIKQRKQETLDSIRKPNMGDRVRKWTYSQLPYHPQMLWTGAQFDAELTAPLTLPQAQQTASLPLKDMQGHPPVGVIEARLISDLNSKTAKKGEPIDAVLTKPLLTSDSKQMILPEGTHMQGAIMQTQAARWFARNGKLRFTFHKIDMPASSQAAPQEIHGQLLAAEASPDQNVAIDSEGAAKSTPGRDKYLAPMVLGVMAAASMDRDAGAVRGGVVSNGFGLAARVIALATANRSVAQGFAYFALSKSIYYRWIARGNEITFPKNTRLEITLNER